MSVCALVIEAGGDADQAIAGLLHDAVEDQGGRPTLDTIRHMFGDRVAAVVLSCSDSTATNPDEKLDWHERKDEYLERLRTASEDALLVSAADKLHNARAILSDYREGGQIVGKIQSLERRPTQVLRRVARCFGGNSGSETTR